MKLNHQTRFAILIVTITLALTSATVSTTTGTFLDEERVNNNEIESEIYGSESANSSNGTQTVEIDQKGSENQTVLNGMNNGGHDQSSDNESNG